ncbi:alpha-tocopherol transfer protein-like [Petromyzon marinus]|uniref:Alpha-tocopherol transfer protein-like n=1 Tax=Petromyzon marinus TaxID=7757 RepID=A0AAJ7WUD5_PETMA|nr:alpha-tocopherol transfer protein-like [Petromyzon marinus]XP_032810514.1 alpha-tocopherol transfer protein-like [Petromyzon marinus]
MAILPGWEMTDAGGPAEPRDLPNEHPVVRARVRELRGLALRDLPGVPICLADDFLMAFVRARDLDCAQAFQLLRNYHRWREECSELVGDLRPGPLLPLLARGYHGALARPDTHGRTVLLYRVDRWDPKVHSATEVFRVSLLTSELLARDARTQLRGVTVIFDLRGLRFGHVARVGPTMARRIASVLTDSFPIKVRSIHLLNTPLIFQSLFAIIRPFLSEKMYSRIHVHSGDAPQSLVDEVGPSVMPAELGGEGPSVEEVCAEWTQVLLGSEMELRRVTSLHHDSLCPCKLLLLKD